MDDASLGVTKLEHNISHNMRPCPLHRDYCIKSAGMFARACQAASIKDAGKDSKAAELLSEVRVMKDMLISRMASIFQSTSEDPENRTQTIWSNVDEQDAISTALSPRLMKARQGVQALLYEVLTLEVIITSGTHS